MLPYRKSKSVFNKPNIFKANLPISRGRTQQIPCLLPFFTVSWVFSACYLASTNVNPVSAGVNSVSANVPLTSVNVNPVPANVYQVSAGVNLVPAGVPYLSANVGLASVGVNPLSANVSPASNSVKLIPARAVSPLVFVRLASAGGYLFLGNSQFLLVAISLTGSGPAIVKYAASRILAAQVY